MKIPWTARKTNDEVLQMARGYKELLTVIRRMQISFIGHILRGSGLERECLLRMIKGRRAGRRQRMKYKDSINLSRSCVDVEIYQKYWGRPMIEVSSVPLQPMSTWTRYFGKVIPFIYSSVAIDASRTCFKLVFWWRNYKTGIYCNWAYIKTDK